MVSVPYPRVVIAPERTFLHSPRRRSRLSSALRHLDGRRLAIGIRRELLLGFLDPLSEPLLGDRLDGDRHVAVIRSADFRALAVIATFAVDPRPGLVQAARNG